MMRTPRASRLMWLLAGVTLAASARGQVAPSGDHVRLTESTTTRPLKIGQLIRQTPDRAVIFSACGSSLRHVRAFLLSCDQRLERSVGLRRGRRHDGARP